MVVVALSVVVTLAGPSAVAPAAAEALGQVSYFGMNLSGPFDAITGLDGNTWYANAGYFYSDHPTGSISRVTPQGEVTTFFDANMVQPRGLTVGPDGDVWFTSRDNGRIGRITTTGMVTTFPMEADVFPDAITTGPDGNLWFTAGNRIGRMSTDGSYTTFSAPWLDSVADISTGPDGALWFTNTAYYPKTGSIGRITTSGAISEFSDPAIFHPAQIMTGPDGQLWFTQAGGAAKMTTAGVVKTVGVGRGVMTVGPDGNVWFTQSLENLLRRVTPAGVVTNFPVPAAGGAITTGSDGALWFVMGNSLGRLTTDGAFQQHRGTWIDHPRSLRAGPDGTLWWANFESSSIGRVTVTGMVSHHADPNIVNPQVVFPANDGTIWFVNGGPSDVRAGRMTTDGVVTMFGQPEMDGASGFVVGPDGEMWFTKRGVVGRRTAAGVITTFTDPALVGGGSIAVGADGNLWVSNAPFSGTGAIGRMTPTGQFTSFPGDGVLGPDKLMLGPDNRIWFVNQWNASLGQITTDGAITYSPGWGIYVNSIATGPDGKIWLVGDGPHGISPQIIRVEPTGGFLSSHTGLLLSPSSIVRGPDDNMWFLNANNAVGRIGTGAPPVGNRFFPMSPHRVLDSRDGTGGFGQPWDAGATRNVVIAGETTGVPANATAVVLNVTAIAPSVDTHLTVWPAGQTRPTASNLNLPPHAVRPNQVVVAPGADLQASIFNNAGTVDVVADVVGYFVADTSGSLYTSMSPKRLLDSRDGTGGFSTRWGPAEARVLAVTGGSTGVPADATSVVVNVTATGGSQSTHLTLSPAGEAVPVASTLNIAAGETAANLASVKVGASGGLSIFNNTGNVDVIIDVVGFYRTSSGSIFVPLTPHRVLDSRDGTGGVSSPWGAGVTRSLTVTGGSTTVPAAATAVVLNLTGVGSSSATHLTAWPAGEGMPVASNLNLVKGDVRPNMAIVKVGAGGQVSIFNNAGTVDVVGDVAGYYQ